MAKPLPSGSRGWSLTWWEKAGFGISKTLTQILAPAHISSMRKFFNDVPLGIVPIFPEFSCRDF